MPASIVDATQNLEAETKFVIKQVGVVGLGHMGHAFAANLVKDGYQVLGSALAMPQGSKILPLATWC